MLIKKLWDKMNAPQKELEAEFERLRLIEAQMANLENLAGWLAHDVPVLQIAVEWAKLRGESQVSVASRLRSMWERRP